MPAVTETYSLGVPVEISRIDHELKKLWQESEGAMTRASLMNLAVYSEEPGSLNSNTQLMARITERPRLSRDRHRSRLQRRRRQR